MEFGSQTELESIILNILDQNRGETNISIPIPLYGELDFGFLSQNTTIPPKIRELIFQKGGKIKSLKNLPKDLEILECRDNQIKSILGKLPRNLKEVRLSNNELGSLDLAETPQLILLDLRNNRLTSLTNFPASLKDLYISNNPTLSVLDLDNIELNEFDEIDDPNSRIIIKNYDPDRHYERRRQNGGGRPKKEAEAIAEADNDVEAKAETENQEPPYKKDSPKETGQDDQEEDSPPFVPSSPPSPKYNYQEVLNKYFEYKKQYERSAKQWRKRLLEKSKTNPKSKTKSKDQYPPCIKCKQPVGMTFKKDDNRYIAKCGLGKKYYCDFQIELNAGTYVDFLKEFESIYQDFQQNKESLVKIKMENLFGYQEDKETTKEFKREMDKYKENNEYLPIIMEDLYKIYGTNIKTTYELESMEKEFAEAKKEYQEAIQEYETDALNQPLLDDAMELYMTKIRKLAIEYIRKKYPVMEMNEVFPAGKEMGFLGKEESTQLFQLHSTPNIYCYELEEPKVIKFMDVATEGTI